VSDINWHEIAEKYKPLMVLKPDVIIFYPSNGGIFEEKQILSDSKTFFVNAVAHELFNLHQ